MPVPIMAPIPSMVRLSGPRARLRLWSVRASAWRSVTLLRLNKLVDIGAGILCCYPVNERGQRQSQGKDREFPRPGHGEQNRYIAQPGFFSFRPREQARRRASFFGGPPSGLDLPASGTQQTEGEAFAAGNAVAVCHYNIICCWARSKPLSRENTRVLPPER